LPSPTHPGWPMHRIPIPPVGVHILASNRARPARPPLGFYALILLRGQGHTRYVPRRPPHFMRSLRFPFLCRCRRWNRRPSRRRIRDRRCQRPRHSHLRRSFSMWCAMRHYWHPSRFHIDRPHFLTVSSFPTPMRIFLTRRTRDRARSESAHGGTLRTTLPPSDGSLPRVPSSVVSMVSDPNADFQSDSVPFFSCLWSDPLSFIITHHCAYIQHTYIHDSTRAFIKPVY